MKRRDAFEQCIRFVSRLEGSDSELDLAEQIGYEIEDDDLARAVVHRLQRAIEWVKKHAYGDDKFQLLYHIALYADAISRTPYGISLCYIVINHPDTTNEYKELATDWLVNAKRLLPEKVYDDEVKATVLDIEKALDDALEWLKIQQKHATQPATKHVINADLIKKQLSDDTET